MSEPAKCTRCGAPVPDQETYITEPCPKSPDPKEGPGHILSFKDYFRTPWRTPPAGCEIANKIGGARG